MHTTSESSRDMAALNALFSINQKKRLPSNVFSGQWEGYLFFEPHAIFCPCFMELKNLLLLNENASVIALINLGNTGPASDKKPNVIFLDKHVSSKEYMAQLIGDGAAMNWMFLMDRYVCASDRENWSIYCEKENDVGVFAFRNNFSISAEVEALLKANSIKSALVASPEKYERFSFNKLVPSWRSTLINEYI